MHVMKSKTEEPHLVSGKQKDKATSHK
ncbi:uncharacterized protein G2W53_044005 [Senna tora]|uniref:Uncharacterized protein n=1 Tax=Senna tora TaxID=362788 RepID=A0A834SJK9_9FABA|nr:uncharacterized protein G2W53_044005 [Senna tora]